MDSPSCQVLVRYVWNLLLRRSKTSNKLVSHPLSPFSTRRLFSREATFSFVGIAFTDVISDADKGKSRFVRKKSPSGKRALVKGAM